MVQIECKYFFFNFQGSHKKESSSKEQANPHSLNPNPKTGGVNHLFLAASPPLPVLPTHRNPNPPQRDRIIATGLQVSAAKHNHQQPETVINCVPKTRKATHPQSAGRPFRWVTFRGWLHPLTFTVPPKEFLLQGGLETGGECCEIELKFEFQSYFMKFDVKISK